MRMPSTWGIEVAQEAPYAEHAQPTILRRASKETPAPISTSAILGRGLWFYETVSVILDHPLLKRRLKRNSSVGYEKSFFFFPPWICATMIDFPKFYFKSNDIDTWSSLRYASNVWRTAHPSRGHTWFMHLLLGANIFTMESLRPKVLSFFI